MIAQCPYWCNRPKPTSFAAADAAKTDRSPRRRVTQTMGAQGYKLQAPIVSHGRSHFGAFIARLLSEQQRQAVCESHTALLRAPPCWLQAFLRLVSWFFMRFFYGMTCIAGGLQVGLNNGPSSRLTPALGDAKNKKSIFASTNQVKRCCWSYVVFGRSSYQLRFASETRNPIDSKIW